MAVRIPDARAIQPVGSPRDPGVGASAEDFGVGVGVQVSRLGGQIAEIADRAMARDETIENQKLRTQFALAAQQELDERDRRGEMVGSDAAASYASWVTQKREEILGRSTGRQMARARLENDLTGLGARQELEGIALNSRRAYEAVDAAITDRISPSLDEVANNPLGLYDVYDEIEAAIAENADALTDAQERQIRERETSRAALAAINGRFLADDVSGVNLILADERTKGLLPIEDRQKFAQQAANAQDRIDARQEKAFRDWQEENAIDARLKNMRGELTEAELMGMLERREIDRVAFEQLLRTTTGGAAEDNPTIMLELFQGIYDGTVGSEQVFDAFGANAIKPETAKQMIDLVDEVARRPGLLARDDVKRERTWLRGELGGIAGLFAVLDPADSQRVNDATREFNDRVLEAGPDVNPRLIAEQIARSPVYRRPMRIPLPLTPEQLDAAEEEILRALDAEELTPAAAARELQRIEESREAQAESLSVGNVSSAARERVQ